MKAFSKTHLLYILDKTIDGTTAQMRIVAGTIVTAAGTGAVATTAGTTVTEGTVGGTGRTILLLIGPNHCREMSVWNSEYL